MQLQKQHVIIIGGGVSGLALAAALHEAGGSPTVYEASPRLTSLGGGLLIAPNSVRVLEDLGLHGLVQVHGIPLSRMNIFDHTGKLLYTRHQNEVANMYGGRSLMGISRSELHRALADLLPEGTVHTGMRLVGLNNSFYQAEALFHNGHRVEADLLVGADGRESTVRSVLYPQTQLVPTGDVAYRGITSAPLGELEDAFSEFWGSGRRFTCFRMSSKLTYWHAPVQQSVGPMGEIQGLLSKNELLEAFAEFPRAVQQLIDRTDARDISALPLSDISPLPEWWNRHVVLVGDAAHATSPNLGQGAAQALEDVTSLARHLVDEDNRVNALHAYQQEREHIANAQTLAARQFGKVGRVGGLGRIIRNAALSINPDLARQRIEAFYGPAQR